MYDLNAIIDECVALTQTVASVGQVHAYQRGINSDSEFQKAFVDDNGKLLAWMWTRSATDVEDQAHTSKDRHTLLLRGYMGVEDAKASEREFQTLVEKIRAVFQVNRKLNGKVIYSSRMKVTQVTTGMFRGVLVHYCEIVLPVEVFPIDKE